MSNSRPNRGFYVIRSKRVIMGISCSTNNRPLLRRSQETLGKFKCQGFIKLLFRADTQIALIHMFKNYAPCYCAKFLDDDISIPNEVSEPSIQLEYDLIWPSVDMKGVNQHVLDYQIDELDFPMIESSAPF